MSGDHFLLIILWILYYVVHSVAAATIVKDFFHKKLKDEGLYRLMYTLFAFITLAGILLFQYSFASPQLFSLNKLVFLPVFCGILPGMIIMIISIKKYFVELSGIRHVMGESEMVELKVNGIHNFVRHPLYSGTLLFVWGLFFVFPYLNNLICVILLTLYVLIGVKFEENKLVLVFGQQYKDYSYSVPRFIPKLFRGIKKGSY